jgi:hypothetical protein
MPGPPERARSSAGEHSLHTGGVTGSIPVAPTIKRLQNRYFSYCPLPFPPRLDPVRMANVPQSLGESWGNMFAGRSAIERKVQERSSRPAPSRSPWRRGSGGAAMSATKRPVHPIADLFPIMTDEEPKITSQAPNNTPPPTMTTGARHDQPKRGRSRHRARRRRIRRVRRRQHASIAPRPSAGAAQPGGLSHA